MDKEGGKINREIKLLSELLDLDKSNHGRAVSNLIGIAVMTFAVLTIMISLCNSLITEELIKFLLIGISLFIIAIIFWKVGIDYFGEINSNRIRTKVRMEMIKERYKKLGINVKKLDEEFKEKESEKILESKKVKW